LLRQAPPFCRAMSTAQHSTWCHSFRWAQRGGRSGTSRRGSPRPRPRHRLSSGPLWSRRLSLTSPASRSLVAATWSEGKHESLLDYQPVRSSSATDGPCSSCQLYSMLHFTLLLVWLNYLVMFSLFRQFFLSDGFLTPHAEEIAQTTTICCLRCAKRHLYMFIAEITTFWCNVLHRYPNLILESD
jgi:hypothetical protein